MKYPVFQDTKSGVTQIFYEDWTWLNVTIPKGFPTDGTTAPQLFRIFLPRKGKYVFASYLHDYCLTIMPRKQAADKFVDGLVELNAPTYEKIIRYSGVRFYDFLVYLKLAK